MAGALAAETRQLSRYFTYFVVYDSYSILHANDAMRLVISQPGPSSRSPQKCKVDGDLPAERKLSLTQTMDYCRHLNWI